MPDADRFALPGLTASEDDGRVPGTGIAANSHLVLLVHDLDRPDSRIPVAI
jgi:hypothetical protein